MKNQLFLACAFALPLAATARAAEGMTPGSYVRFGAGIAIVEDIEGFADTLFDPRVDYDLNLDPGVRIDVAPGYAINEFLGLELSTGFVWNSVDAIEFEDGQRGRVDGDLLQIPIMGNIVARIPTPMPLTPFVGAGAGGSYVRLSDDEADEAGDDFFAAFQLFGGIKYELDEVMAYGLVYKYMHVFSEEEERIGAESAGLGDITTHSISAVVTFRF